MAEGDPINNIVPADSDARIQRAKLDFLRNRDQAFSQTLGDDDTVESAIRNYELAYRMQSLVPDVLDLTQETEATHNLYGIDSQVDSQRQYGIQCLRARRLIEQGVRFVEITCPPGASNGTWDQHSNLKKGHEKNALDTDQAIAGLIKDLKARGLFDETLILWAGEFGRTPHSSGATAASTIRKASASGSPAAVSKGAPSTERPTTRACSPSKTPSPCTTCTPRFCICSGWTTNG